MPASDSIKSYQTISAGESEQALKSFPKTTITVLGAVRAVTGAGLIIAPVFFGRMFHVPVTASSALLARGFGTRDLVLGELLLTADANAKDRKEVKRALWAGVATDALDIGTTVFALATGQLSRTGAGMFGGAAAGLVLMGIYSLRNM